MSRGGWVMLIAGVALLVGIGLFAFGVAGLFAGFTPETTTLAPGAYLNRTVDVQTPGSILTYLVEIRDFAEGDEVIVFVQLPSGGEAQRATVNTAGSFPLLYVVTEAGTHTVVLQNTASRSLDIRSAATEIDVTSATLASIGTILGFAGFVLFIIGLLLWIVDRGRARRQRL
ncbi:MAG: hypothetical protein V3U45_02700, partial [bacterium]